MKTNTFLTMLTYFLIPKKFYKENITHIEKHSKIKQNLAIVFPKMPVYLYVFTLKMC